MEKAIPKKKDIIDVSTLDSTLLEALNTYMSSLDYKMPKEALIPSLYKAQALFGYLPQNLQWYVGKKLGLSSAHVNGVVTFYSFFSEEPLGKHTLSVCMGTACFVKGAEKILNKAVELTGAQPGKMSEDGLFSIKDVRCIGACGLAPVMTIDDKVYGKVTESKLEEIIATYKGGNHDKN